MIVAMKLEMLKECQKIKLLICISSKNKTYGEVVNDSVNQTLARSINTSLTTLITLLALYFFGGVTTKDFVLAMILGIAVGTYSSIFFASILTVFYNDIAKKGKVTA
jgi:preprotein translocase subunit SecF